MRIVIIDAGHGGRDPGAVNEELDIKEKDITLAVARLCKRYIARYDLKLIPYYTRGSDEFVGLKERCERANNLEGEAFVSIHCNARPAPGVYGVETEVFHLPNSIHGKDLAQAMLDRVVDALHNLTVGTDMKVINRGIKTANFYVLKHTAMPAALVELGFISDKEEALFLAKVENQRQMAKAIVHGFSDYFL